MLFLFMKFIDRVIVLALRVALASVAIGFMLPTLATWKHLFAAFFLGLMASQKD